MTTPDQDNTDAERDDSPQTDVPPAAPAYATPPPEGLPDAETQ
jgi:hypothetical protein